MAGVAPRPDWSVGPRSGPDCTVGTRSGPDCTVDAEWAPIAPSGPDQGAIALSLLALLYKVTRRHPATPAVRWVPGHSARILGGCGAVWDIARAYFLPPCNIHLLSPCLVIWVGGLDPGTLVETWWNPGGTLVEPVEPSWSLTSNHPGPPAALAGTAVELSWNLTPKPPRSTPQPSQNLVEPWWNPAGTLVEPYLRAAPDHPGAYLG